MIPIIDGVGLYPNGNQVPQTHKDLGIQVSSQITKRGVNGEANSTGKLVFAAIGGMSNAKQEFQEFQRVYKAKHGYKRSLTFFNGNRGAWDARRIAVDDPAGYWSWFMEGLVKRNISPNQIQVAWIKNSVKGQNKPHPQGSNELKLYLNMIINEAVSRFPNLEQILLSSANYSGYAVKPLPRSEPFAFEEGFGVKSLIEERLGQTPWTGWASYFWANGSTPRSDGLFWVRSDFATDGVHPAISAKLKIANMMLKFFEESEVTKGWFI